MCSFDFVKRRPLGLTSLTRAKFRRCASLYIWSFTKRILYLYIANLQWESAGVERFTTSCKGGYLIQSLMGIGMLGYGEHLSIKGLEKSYITLSPSQILKASLLLVMSCAILVFGSDQDTCCNLSLLIDLLNLHNLPFQNFVNDQSQYLESIWSFITCNLVHFKPVEILTWRHLQWLKKEAIGCWYSCTHS